MGQEGYIDSYDPRYAVAFMDSGPVTNLKPSYIRNNAFHHGFSPAIGVYNAQNMPIEDNVVHHCVYFCKYLIPHLILIVEVKGRSKWIV